MLELRRITNEVEMRKCDATGAWIRPTDWYYYDTERDLVFSFDIVKEWKTKAESKILIANIEQEKEWSALDKEEKATKKALVTEAKYAYIEEIQNGWQNNG